MKKIKLTKTQFIDGTLYTVESGKPDVVLTVSAQLAEVLVSQELATIMEK